jgi:hypothetical protein
MTTWYNNSNSPFEGDSIVEQNSERIDSKKHVRSLSPPPPAWKSRYFLIWNILQGKSARKFLSSSIEWLDEDTVIDEPGSSHNWALLTNTASVPPIIDMRGYLKLLLN